MRSIVGFAVVLLLAAAPLHARAGAPANPLQTRHCVEGKAKVPAECGTLRVFENRAAQSGRTILIHFVLLKAVHPSGKAIYVNLGGPGEELAEVAAIADGQFLKELQTLRGHYDILFVDERGFGQSHPIPCNFAPVADPAAYFLNLWPDRILSACVAKEAKASDLARYNTPAAIGDLDDLRAALGYKQLIFDVASYGTFTALLYMRAYPDNVESAVLQGVAPPGIMNEAREFALGAQDSLDRLVSECDADATCRAHFPDFRQHFYALLHRMDSAPIPVQVRLPDKRIETVKLSREVFADAIRHLLYDPQSAALVPLMIERAYGGHTLLLGNAVELVTQGFAQGIDGGAFLSYTCAEVMPFTNGQADLQYARTTWFGADRPLAQQAACKIWNVPTLTSVNQPVRSSVPVLMVNGTDDPATPPYEAKAELHYLSRGALMLVRHAPHDAESPCVDRTIERFIRTGTATGLNLNACSASFKRPQFALTAPAFLL